MQWMLKENRPVYHQLQELITLQIFNGTWQAGEKLKPVGELASEAGVNANTMQRALVELERQGLLYNEQRNGRYVTKDITLIMRLRENLAEEQVNKFLAYMKLLGYDKRLALMQLEMRERGK